MISRKMRRKVVNRFSFWMASSAVTAVGLVIGAAPSAVSGERAVSCHGRPATVIGSAAADEIVGGDGADVIVTRKGADSVRSGRGDDTICLGAGFDVAEAGDGRDLVHGAAGDEIANGGPGRDQLTGGDGSDVLSGGSHRDLLRGRDGVDELDGGPQLDSCIGGEPRPDERVATPLFAGEQHRGADVAFPGCDRIEGARRGADPRL